ncbi:serine/threonine protein kinase [Nocardia yamanashiensis]|uniref:serine/threonine-protein kinase n=1 Tax=Nocardia yamanashiensis TaxID=209247 RepID=UPI001E58ED43|nr:serine/threonine-protein kinase [Nocardia yamanashiensis]UGT41809.1 serine/threonine protein kinase [Nocardia yamanashiensis]
MRLEVNDTFAGYRLARVLGEGGMGTVYLAEHPRLPRQIALKLLNLDIAVQREWRDRFEREANLVARLDHPNIVAVQDRGVHDGRLWIAMQYVHGTDAARLDPRTVSVERAVRIIAETGAALDYAHGQGILHRDVKPANILLSAPESGRAERAVLTDFGIARLAESNTQLTTTGTFSATLAYASPEQLSAEPLDHRSDQYSLACTLFTILAGQPPFAATNPGQVVAGHLNKPVPPLRQIRTDVPEALDAVIARAMAKNREHRFASCTEFAHAAWAAVHGSQSAPAPAHDPRRSPTMVLNHGIPLAESTGPAAPTLVSPATPPTQVAPPAGQGWPPNAAAPADPRSLPPSASPPTPAVNQGPHASAPRAAIASLAAVAAGDPISKARPRGRRGAIAASVLALLCAAIVARGVQRLHVRFEQFVSGKYPPTIVDSARVSLTAATAYAAVIGILLIAGALLLWLHPRTGRVLAALGSLGFIVGIVGGQLYVHGFASFAATLTLGPLREPLAIGLCAIGIALGIATLVCAISVRRR